MFYQTRHKVFISFYHNDDQYYKRRIERSFGYCFVNKSVLNGEYDSDDSDTYIKRLIREEKISDSSVVVVLVGQNTFKRKHIDWEIYAGLSARVNGRAGLVGVLLPEFNVHFDKLPRRLYTNYKSGYAKIYSWQEAMLYWNLIIQEAFDNRVKLFALADNSDLQMQRNLW